MRAALLLQVALLLLSARAAHAEPRFALREGVSCRTCHVNPSGAGMRNRYGRYVYAKGRLPRWYPRVAGHLATLDVDMNDSLAFGADARLAFIHQDTPDENVETLSSFFQMQADLYVGARLFDGLTLYYDQGAYGSFEAQAIYQYDFDDPSFALYIKAGRFMPAYGLRLPNHNLFIREQIGFGPLNKDVGVELGGYLGPLFLQLAALNGMAPENQLDDNHRKGLVGRADVVTRIGFGRLMAGGSIYYNVAGTDTSVDGTTIDTRVTHLRAGAHWGLAIGRFAYLGEVDVVTVDPFAGNHDTERERSLRTYQELDVQVVRGLDVNFNHELREPDIELQSGTLHRVAVGFELFPIPHLELKALYRQSFGSGPAEQQQDGLKELIAMVHLFF